MRSTTIPQLSSKKKATIGRTLEIGKMFFIRFSILSLSLSLFLLISHKVRTGGKVHITVDNIYPVYRTVATF